MAVPELKYAIGNAASTTLSVAASNSDTSATITSDTNFAAKSGEGMVIIDEDQDTEEYAYSASKSSNTLSLPLVNRGLEGGSAQSHAINATVKGIITAGMWNDLVDALTNVLDQTTGAVDTTKVVTPTGTQTLTNKTMVFASNTLTNVMSTTTAQSVTGLKTFAPTAAFNVHSGVVDLGTVGATETVNWASGDRQKMTLDENLTITFSNTAEGQTLTLYMLQDGSGTNSITFSDTITWSDATTPSWSTTADKMNIAVITKVGSAYFGVGNKFA